MLKESVTYTDFNGAQRTEELYFNLTKTEMASLLDLQPRLEQWAEQTSGDPRDMTMTEIKELLEIIKLLISKAYGVKTEDGRHFRKSPEAWEDFKDSAVYDAFTFGLFEDPLKAVGFMNGILPADLADQATTQQLASLPSMPAQPQPTPAPNLAKDPSLPVGPQDQGETYTATVEEIPAWMREGRNPTPQEFSKMTDAEKLAAFQAKSAGPR